MRVFAEMEAFFAKFGFVCLVFSSDFVLEAAALQVLVEAFVAGDCKVIVIGFVSWVMMLLIKLL